MTRIRINVPAAVVVDTARPIDLRYVDDSLELTQGRFDDADEAIIPSVLILEGNRYRPVILPTGVPFVMAAKVTA